MRDLPHLDEFELNGNKPTGPVTFADGRRVPVAEQSSTEGFLGRFAAEFPHIAAADAQEIMAFADEHLPARRMDRQSDIAQETLDAVRRLLCHFAKVFSVLIKYQDAQTEPKFIRMSTRMMALVHDFTDEAGATNPTELARVMGLAKFFGTSGKAAAHKCAKLFIEEKLKLPPLPGRRSDKARQLMTAARLQQLSK